MNDSDSHTRFTFERLDAYCVARDVLRDVVAQRSKLRGLPGEIAGQLERAAVSTVANIAEGAGRVTRADKRARWAIARGEANEVAALVEIAAALGAITPEVHAPLRARLLRLTAMLHAMSA